MRLIGKTKLVGLITLGLVISSCNNDFHNEQVLPCVSVPSKFRDGSLFSKNLGGFDDDGSELIEIPIKHLRSTHSNLALFFESKPEYRHGLRFVLTIQNPEKTRENTNSIFRTFLEQNSSRYEVNPEEVSFAQSLNLWKHNTSTRGGFFKLATHDLREAKFEENIPMNTMVGSCSFRGQYPFSIEKTPFSCSANFVDGDILIGMTLDSREMRIREDLFKAALDYVKSWRKECITR